MRRQMITAAVAVALTVVQASMAATQPPAPVATPATQPAPAATETAGARVLVAPFVEANDQQRADWISRAIQQAVMDALGALSEVDVVSFAPAPANPTPAQARSAGIKYIVR